MHTPQELALVDAESQKYPDCVRRLGDDTYNLSILMVLPTYEGLDRSEEWRQLALKHLRFSGRTARTMGQGLTYVSLLTEGERQWREWLNKDLLVPVDPGLVSSMVLSRHRDWLDWKGPQWALERLERTIPFLELALRERYGEETLSKYRPYLEGEADSLGEDEDLDKDLPGILRNLQEAKRERQLLSRQEGISPAEVEKE